VRVIGMAGGRLYVAPDAGHMPLYPPGHQSHRNTTRLAYLPTGDGGRPTSGNLRVLPGPRVSVPTRITTATIIGGKVCLGTAQSGVFVHDPAKKQWTACRAKHGVPYVYVRALLGLAGPVALCSGGGRGQCSLYTLDVSTLDVILRRSAPARGYDPPFAAWRHRGRWATAHRSGVTRDTLAAEAKLAPWPATPQGWPRARIVPATTQGDIRGKLAMAVVAGRRFVGLHDGLREIDQDGRTLRVWPTDYIFRVHVRELKLYNTFE
ncbi:unnamed protein product, partial [marine sediment metagenome]